MILNSDEVFGENVETANQDDIDRIHMILFVKDKFNVSGEFLGCSFPPTKTTSSQTLWGWNEHRKAPSCNKHHFHTSR